MARSRQSERMRGRSTYDPVDATPRRQAPYSDAFRRNPLTPAETYCNSFESVRRLEGAKVKVMLRACRAAVRTYRGRLPVKTSSNTTGDRCPGGHFAFGWVASG